MRVNCEECGREFSVKPCQIRKGEGRFCNKKCAAIALHRSMGHDGNSDTNTRLIARTVYIESGKPMVCAKCKKTPVLIHHKDLDPTNNEIDNLQPLCRSHHTQLHVLLRHREAA